MVLLTLFLVSGSALAQSADRDEVLRQIESMRAQIKQMEPILLAPAAADTAKYADFLNQPGTGLCRLVPRELYDGLLSTRGGGAYYSFTKRSNSYNSTPQISLEQGHLRSGFAGADYSYLTSLGDIPLDQVGLDHEAVQFLVSLKTPTAEPAAREAYRKVAEGFEGSGYIYKSYLPVLVNSTYVLRGINYRESDILVAFRVIRQDSDGSVVLLWKVLKTFPIPQLLRPQQAESQ
jgi:hypothetical protein